MRAGSRPFERRRHVLTLSAETDSALVELAGRYQQYLTAHPEADLGDLAFTMNAGRTHFQERLALTAGTRPKPVNSSPPWSTAARVLPLW